MASGGDNMDAEGGRVMELSMQKPTIGVSLSHPRSVSADCSDQRRVSSLPLPDVFPLTTRGVDEMSECWAETELNHIINKLEEALKHRPDNVIVPLTSVERSGKKEKIGYIRDLWECLRKTGGRKTYDEDSVDQMLSSSRSAAEHPLVRQKSGGEAKGATNECVTDVAEGSLGHCVAQTGSELLGGKQQEGNEHAEATQLGPDVTDAEPALM